VIQSGKCELFYLEENGMKIGKANGLIFVGIA
jgi:hypothetical protein